MMTTTATTATPRPSFAALAWERGKTEIRVFFREWDSLIFVLLFPTMFLLLFAAIMGKIDVTEGMNVPITVKFSQYFLPGMIASGIVYTGFQNLAISIPVERDQGVLKRLRGTPLPPAAYFAGKILQVIVVSIVQLGLLFVVAKLMGIPLPTEAKTWLTFAWVFLLAISASTVLGLAMSSVPRTGKSASAVVIPGVLILQFISGVYFPFNQIPSWMQEIAGVFPLRWMAEAMRGVFLPDFMRTQEPGQSWHYGQGAIIVAVWLVIGIVLALRTFRWQARKDG
jgi:ABC-2 type transport system permease protein